MHNAKLKLQPTTTAINEDSWFQFQQYFTSPILLELQLLTLIGWTGEGLLVMSVVSGDGVWKKAVLCWWRANFALACSNDTRNQPNPPSLRENQEFHKLLFAKVHAHGKDNIWKLDLM